MFVLTGVIPWEALAYRWTARVDDMEGDRRDLYHPDRSPRCHASLAQGPGREYRDPGIWMWASNAFLNVERWKTGTFPECQRRRRGREQCRDVLDLDPMEGDEGQAMGIELGGCLLGFPVHIRSSGIKVKTARGRRSGPGRGCQPSSWPGAFPDHCFRPKLKHGLTENLSTGCISGLQRISPHQPLRSLAREASCSD